MKTKTNLLQFPELDPWPEPVNGKDLLDQLVALLKRFFILPKWGPEIGLSFDLSNASQESHHHLKIRSKQLRSGKDPSAG